MTKKTARFDLLLIKPKRVLEGAQKGAGVELKTGIEVSRCLKEMLRLNDNQVEKKGRKAVEGKGFELCRRSALKSVIRFRRTNWTQ